MLSINQILVPITHSVFLVLAMISLLDFLRYRDSVRRDIALMFSSLAIAVMLAISRSLQLIPADMVAIGTGLAVTAQPYLLIRMIRYFQAVPAWLRMGATFATALFWIGVILTGPSLPPLMSVMMVIYLVSVNGYALVAFAQGALNRSGVVQQRLRFAASGLGLLALALAWAGFGILFPSFDPIADTLVQITAIASGLTLFIGFATPQWLQDMWQLVELRRFLLEIAPASRSDTVSKVYASLGQAALRATGGHTALVLERDDAQAQWMAFDLNNGDEPSILPQTAEFDALCQKWSNAALSADQLSPALHDALHPDSFEIMYVVALTRHGRTRGLVIVLLEYGSLFVRDDLQLLHLLAEQTAISLENIDLIAQQRRHAASLEEQVAARTKELVRRNSYISLLHEITKAANEATSSEEALQRAVDLTCTILDFPLGHVFLPSKDSPDVFKASGIWYMDSPDRFQNFRAATDHLQFTSDQDTITLVIQAAKVSWYTHIADVPDFMRAEVARRTGIETALFIPILIMKKSVAVLELFSDRVMEPDDEILDILAQIGAQLGRALERTQADTRLRESERRFRLIADAAPLPLAISRQADSKFLYANQAALQLYGVGAEVLAAQRVSDFYVDTAERQVFLDLLTTQGFVKGYEIQIRRPADGLLLWVSVTNQPVKFEGHTAMFATLIDITENRNAQLALLESQKRFQNTFEQAAVGIAHVSVSGQFIRVNERFGDIAGYSSDELIQLTFRDITYPDDLDAVSANLEELLQGKIERHSMENRYIKKNGDVVWTILTTSLVREEDGTPDYFIAVIEDISTRKHLERELHDLNRDLERRVQQRTAHLDAVNQELEAFSYSVSHDLRAPLRAVDGFSQALLEDYEDRLDDMGRDFLHRIRAESQRMGALIDDLLALSRFTRMEMQHSSVNLSEIVRDIGAQLAATEPERDVTLSIQPDLTASGDERLLRVILQNLLENAWKFSSKQPCTHIEFGAVESDGVLEYFVRDNGAGFNMDYAHKLFGAFQRLHTTAEFDGTGIGLATVQRIVNRHGGAVRAEAAINKGATFYFSLGEDKHE